MFVYCKKCGAIHNSKIANVECEACGIQMDIVPNEYLTPSGIMFASNERRKEFESIIKQGEEYNDVCAQNRDAIIKEKELQRSEEISKKVDEYNRSRVKIACPVCHSEMLDRISNVGKVVKVGVFGILGAGDIGKKYKCRSCGYRF